MFDGRLQECTITAIQPDGTRWRLVTKARSKYHAVTVYDTEVTCGGLRYQYPLPEPETRYEIVLKDGRAFSCTQRE